MQITVLFFATLKDKAGTRKLDLELDEGTQVQGLRRIIADRFPALAPALASALISVNRQYAFDDELIPPQAEIALFPPVSGGSITM